MEPLTTEQTLFLIKDPDEYCFLYSEEDPQGLYEALLECASSTESNLTSEEALEVIEEVVADQLRRI